MADLPYTLPITGRDHNGFNIDIDEDGCMSVLGFTDPDATPHAHLLTREEFQRVRHLLER